MKKIYVTQPLFPDLNEYSKKLEEIWDSKWLSNGGHQHQLLENKLTEYLKVPYLSLFNNGTIALMVAVQSLRLSGDVITTPFTFPATSHVLTWNGIIPNFCDIDPVTMNLDPAKIEHCITPKTTGILATHVFGTPCDIKSIQGIADKYGLRVIYDGAHVFGCEIDGNGIGNYGDITMFSFHPTKLFHTAEGGALTYKDPSLKKRIDLLKNFGIKNEFEVVMPGINGKMNELQAAMGLIVLDLVEEEMKKREKIKNYYMEIFSPVEGISIMPFPENVKPSFQYFAVRFDQTVFKKSRDTVYDDLRREEIYARKYFYPLCSEYVCYRQLASAARENLPNAYKVVDEVLCLPFYGDLTETDIERICSLILK
jgi:dTDP-4-amino-4,6-dideoxygalactose transaminase